MVTPGTRIGPYEVVAQLGAGGMGEVYRAREARLNRDVAIKLLPGAFAADPERLARFEREAQTLAALNHPNIAHIYGVLESPPALVMELVEGEDLTTRIEHGPIPLDDALPIARQIADALETAHEQGIVHRDLKPANIKVRRDGTVKVLDFGLAKAMDPAGARSGVDVANSPTFTSQGTVMGVIIGTAAYMAPEQARGRTVDRRADVWAFGVVLFEMLTGRRAFEGDDISDVLASVLKSEPDWTAVPADTPASIRRLLRRCLEKDPRKRLSAIGDARLELDEKDLPAPAASVSVAAPPRRDRLVSLVAAFAAGALLTALAGGLVWYGRQAPVPGVQRFSLLPPPGTALFPDSTGVVISPDGTMVAFVVGSVVRSDTQLWVRSLDSMAARRLDETDGAMLPFWSPDSRQIGFFSSTKLKAVSVFGGRPRVLADIHGGGRGATWSASNVIVFAPDASGPLFRVNATGGALAQLTAIDASRGQYGHRFPSFLPDGDHFTYAALPGRNGKFEIFIGSLSGAAPVSLGSMESAPGYASGYLLYGRQGVLMAQPFDLRALKLTGDPVALADEPSSILDPITSYTASRPVSIAGNDTLAYFSSPSLNTTAEWYDAKGERTGTLPLPPGHYESIRISPDGTHAAVVRSLSPSESSLWLADLARGGATPLSSGAGRNDSPVWSPDGSKVIFSSDRDGAENFFVKSVGEAAPEQPFFHSTSVFKNPSDWSPDGRSIVMTELDPGTGQNVWLLGGDGSGPLKPLVNGAARDIGGRISPDGRWLSYYSDETGRYQLYVQSFPEPGHRVQVSQNGGMAGAWSADGRRMLFVGDDVRSVWRVDVTTGASFSAGTPTLVAQLPQTIVSLDVTPDLQRFLALAPERTGTGAMTIVQNWRGALAAAR